MDNFIKDARNETVNRNKKSIYNTRIVITGDSFLNGINEKGLSKDNHVKIQNFHGGTTKTILSLVLGLNVEKLAKNNPDNLIVHTGTNDTVKGKYVLTNVKKFLGKVKRCSPEIEVVFSDMIVQKHKKNIHKDVIDTNVRLKNFRKI